MPDAADWLVGINTSKVRAATPTTILNLKYFGDTITSLIRSAIRSAIDSISLIYNNNLREKRLLPHSYCKIVIDDRQVTFVTNKKDKGH
jgi:hypothetical protein